MASETQARRFLRKTGCGANDPEVFSDAEIDDIFAEAYEHYPTGEDSLIMAWAVVEGFDNILAQVAKLTSYTQNASSESQGQIHDHLLQDRKNAQDKLEDEENNAFSNVRFGSYGGRGVPPTRRKDFPNA
jgi:hypothetical protein